jgi:hypothetical protein
VEKMMNAEQQLLGSQKHGKIKSKRYGFSAQAHQQKTDTQKLLLMLVSKSQFQYALQSQRMPCLQTTSSRELNCW